jgi:hypothetical protein
MVDQEDFDRDLLWHKLQLLKVEFWSESFDQRVLLHLLQLLLCGSSGNLRPDIEQLVLQLGIPLFKLKDLQIKCDPNKVCQADVFAGPPPWISRPRTAGTTQPAEINSRIREQCIHFVTGECLTLSAIVKAMFFRAIGDETSFDRAFRATAVAAPIASRSRIIPQSFLEAPNFFGFGLELFGQVIGQEAIKSLEVVQQLC